MVVETQEVFTMLPEQFLTFHASMDSLLSIQWFCKPAHQKTAHTQANVYNTILGDSQIRYLGH